LKLKIDELQADKIDKVNNSENNLFFNS
ncbi:MAG: hypothetical protein K0Q87_4388, partial [Neobacillus sp.]|nr:hypothetical protein [Neobacillus sp.]